MTPEGKILQARMKLRKEVPFAGDLLIYLQPTADDAIETMGVNPRGKLTFSPAWVETLTPVQTKAVLTHEIMHLALLHPFRVPPEISEAIRVNDVSQGIIVKMHVFNIACDLKINFMFHDMGSFSDLPEGGCLPTAQGDWHPPAENGMFTRGMTIRGIKEKSMEQLYRELLDHVLADQLKPMQIKLTSSHADWDGEGAAAAEGDKQPFNGLAGDWMVRAASALTQHKGSMPDAMIRAMEDMLTPKIDWRGKLQRFVQPVVACGYSYRRARRSSWVTGIIMPGQDRGGVHIIAHVDTSGSMRKEELEQITGELYGILDAHPHVVITLLHSGAGEPQVIELRETDKEDIMEMVVLRGGGGTSHRPVVKWVLENNHEGLEALVCFTDGLSDIQHCFDDLAGVVVRMLVLTREDQVEGLEPFCDDAAFLPCT